jgi:uncharacterized protein
VNGGSYPCEKVGRAFQIGDIETGIDVSRVKELITAYIDGSTPSCLRCWAVRLCGLCFASARKGTRLDFRRKSERCESEKQLLTRGLQVYATIMSKNPSAFDFVQNMQFS